MLCSHFHALIPFLCFGFIPEYVLGQEVPSAANLNKTQHMSTNKRKSIVPTRITREPEIPTTVTEMSQNQPVFPGNKPAFLKSNSEIEENGSSGVNDKVLVDDSAIHWNEEKLYNLSGSEGSPSVGVDDISTQDHTKMSVSPYSGGEVSEVATCGGKSYMKTPQIDGLLVSRGEGRYEKLIRCDTCGKVCRTSNMARHKRRYCTGVPGTAPKKRGRPWMKGDDWTGSDKTSHTGDATGYEALTESTASRNRDDGQMADSPGEMAYIEIKAEPVSNDGDYGHTST